MSEFWTGCPNLGHDTPICLVRQISAFIHQNVLIGGNKKVYRTLQDERTYLDVLFWNLVNVTCPVYATVPEQHGHVYLVGL